MSEMPAIQPRFLPSGDAAVTVEFGATVDPRLNGLVLKLDEQIAAMDLPGLVETVPTYRSLLVQFDPLSFDYDSFVAKVSAIAVSLSPKQGSRKRWKVPVVYGGAFGIDLEDVAARHGMRTAEVIERHAGAVYRIYMIGFMPGFAYLGGLDPVLATPRRENPRLKTPAGTISIGGAQAAVASVEAPSGWHLLGRTPVRGFMAEREPPLLFEAGDEVVFQPVPESRWEALDRAAAAGEPVAESITP